MYDELFSVTATSFRTMADFKHWTREHIRPLLPHEAAIFGLGHLHAGGVGLDYIVNVDCPVEHILMIRNHAGAIDTPILRRWLATQEPQSFESDHPWPETPKKWLNSFRLHRLHSVIAHAVIDRERCVGTYCSFYKIPGGPKAHHIEILRRLTPLLHDVLYRLIRNLHVGDSTTKDISRLTARERGILPWLRLGKTNLEIARLCNMSESTVKHYLTIIFSKVGVTNRTQLVHVLVEQETWQAPTAQTRVL